MEQYVDCGEFGNQVVDKSVHAHSRANKKKSVVELGCVRAWNALRHTVYPVTVPLFFFSDEQKLKKYIEFLRNFRISF